MIADPDAVVLGDLNLLRAVGRAGLRAVLQSPSPRTARSRYCAGSFEMTPPVFDLEKSARELCALGSALRTRPVLYYSNDAQLLMVSRQREELQRHFRFLMPDPQLIEDMIDKSRFQLLASRKGFPAPRTLLRPAADSGRIEFPWGYPCILKPASRVGWFESKVMGEEPHKVFKVQSAEELERKSELLRARGREFILQEFIGGGDDQIFSFHAYFDRSSSPLAWFVGRKVRTYPLETGRSSCLELVREPQLVELGISTLQSIGFQGVVKVDFKRDPHTGRFYLLEINPRFNLWHYLGAVSGVNLPEVAYRYLHGSWSGPSPVYSTGRCWINVPLDIRAAWSALRKGRLAFWKWLGSYLRPKVFNTFAWDDPRPALFAVRNLVSRTIRACLRRPAGASGPRGVA